MKVIVSKCVLFVCLAAIGPAFAQAVKNSPGRSTICTAAKKQPCAADSCANKCEIFLTLPAGAKYLATHYFTTADNPNDRADVWETGPQELSLARFSEATHAPNQQNAEVVTAYYYNRANRDRKIAITVDYQ
jgi:hypothetical protein